MDNSKKVFFVQETEKGQYETESIWCLVDGRNFIVDNIPFIAKRVSLGDVIKAELDKDDGQYYFEDFVSISGNTTVRIYFYNDNLIEPTRKWLNNLGCESEVLLTRSVVAVNIPKDVNYSSVRVFLDDGEHKKQWVYEESCLVHEY